MKLIQAQKKFDKYEMVQMQAKNHWNNFMDHVKRDLTHAIADKIYNEELIEFVEQEDKSGFTSIKTGLFIANLNEMRKINTLLQSLKCLSHREQALELERIINNKK